MQRLWGPDSLEPDFDTVNNLDLDYELGIPQPR